MCGRDGGPGTSGFPPSLRYGGQAGFKFQVALGSLHPTPGTRPS